MEKETNHLAHRHPDQPRPTSPPKPGTARLQPTASAAPARRRTDAESPSRASAAAQ
jgi:hypothetical protein